MSIKQEDYIAMLRRNPQVRSESSGDRKFIGEKYETFKKHSSSKLQERFLSIWTTLKGPKLEAEYRFHSTRKWRFDFCHLKSSTAIEVNGGIFIKGGHSTGVGIGRDYEKNNAAILAGFQVFQLSSQMLTARIILELIEFCEKKEKFLKEQI